jgi:hypothetical protein
MRLLDTSGCVGTELDGTAADLPDPLPSFLEACAQLAADAVTRGDVGRAQELLAAAAAAVRQASATSP